MKSEVDLELLEEELFARYDRELEVPSDLWSRIESEITPVKRSSYGWWMKIAAVLVLAIGLGSVFLMTQKTETIASIKLPKEVAVIREWNLATEKPVTRIRRTVKPIHTDNPGVLSTDLGYLDIDEQDTAKHIEQTENLLRSIRNFSISDTDDEIDVSYDKALSRRLLIENVVLRREAEMKAKFPTKTLLADLEPFLIDIANLPDQAKPEDVRAIKERVQKTEIVAALVDYQDRSPNNR
ncbi:MAG TPA: hypothetical protein VJS13_06320 [Pyrinomonadaceae bacterium]|nr:hypothetical protein [Pyrinomonadaceae bacterium]